MATGTIRRFIGDSDHGFIAKDGGGDVFADFGKDGDGGPFEEGQAVTFDVVPADGSKVRAENVRRA